MILLISYFLFPNLPSLFYVLVSSLQPCSCACAWDESSSINNPVFKWTEWNNRSVTKGEKCESNTTPCSGPCDIKQEWRKRKYHFTEFY